LPRIVERGVARGNLSGWIYVTTFPDIAVIVPAHNEELYVERALRSLVHQSLPDDMYEIILVDDGSEDATARIAEKFAPHVRLLTNETCLGLPASINRGIQEANARYVVRVDADDYVHPDFLRILHLFLDLNPHMSAIACDYFKVNADEEHVSREAVDASPIGCGIMFRKERLVEIGLYDESFLMAEDLDLRLRFERKWPIHRVELPLYRYRFHGENMTSDREGYDGYIERAMRKNAGE
jgi:glycosyltransferase involved in cell wall biosynthesis